MSGPLRKKVTHRDFERALVSHASAIQKLANSAATDFQTFGDELQRVKGLLADALVSIEALKIQVAGVLAVQDRTE
jgi:hypothetical protein